METQKSPAQREQGRKKIQLLWSFLQGAKGYFLGAVFFAGLTALADTLNPQIIRTAVDCIVDPGAELPALAARLGDAAWYRENLQVLALAMVAVAAVQVVGHYGFRVCNTLGAETLVKTMRDRLYRHIQALPFAWHMKNRTGDIIQRCTSDIDTTKNFLSEQLTSVFRIIILLILGLRFMLAMDPALTLVTMIPTPLVIAYSIRFHNRIFEGFTQCDENEGKLSALAQENLTGVRVVRAFGRERDQIRRFRAQNDHYTALWEKMGRVLSLFWSSSDILSGTQVLLAVTLGAWACIRGRLTEGEYIAFISYNAMLIWPVRQLGRMISEMSKAGVSVDRVAYILNAPAEQEEPGAEEAPMDGDIVFDHVTFGYEEGQPIVQDVSFSMKAGTTLGILGGTGSGKSTLMLLLDKLYHLPREGGTITIGGRDIRKISTAHLRRSIGMVLQEPFLFSRTLGENIGICSPGEALEAIRAAAAAAALDESIMSFPQGYETMVGERGVTLSGGQKQRAAIARTLMQNTPILIFDDSLSAVDTQTDAKIRSELAKRFGKASVILISHRITTLSAADKILVLDKGRIIEEGTHETLKAAGGIYQKIYETQTGIKEEADGRE